MKLTKKLEVEILKLYHKYWDAYLNGKMKTMSSMMDKNIQVIGSGKGEVFKNKKDAVKYYTDTADQVSGKSEVRNKKTNVMPAGSNILVTEESDYFVLMDKSWTFYGQARISTLFGKSKNKWKIIQQHGSLPDSRTGGGEQLNTDKIKEENLRLKEAIKRRTIELENKNKELEIEAALERVRASTMAMQKSAELSETAQVLFQQFSELGETPDQLSIAIVNESERVLETWLSVRGNQFNRMFKVSIDEPIVINKIFKAWKKKKKSLVIDISGNDLKKYNDFRNSLDEFKDYNVIKNSKSKEENRRVIYCAFFSKGMLSLATPEPRPEEALRLLERFASVFDGTYTRFLDLQKAEAQARESEIELALERVRAKTMAMQKSEELKEVIQLVYEQFVHLNIHIEHTGFVMDYKARDDYNIWIADPLGVPSQVTIPYFDSVYYNRFNEAKEKGEDFFATNLSFEEKNNFYQKLFKHIPELPEKAKEFYFSCPGLAASTVLLENVCLYIENFSGIPYSDEENNTLMRFGKVFQQTYTRFLDLQKAEAQAREAQIEVALERVRASAMAMHKSEDINAAVSTVFEELEKLNLDLLRCGIGIINKKDRTGDIWSTVKSGKKSVAQVSGKVSFDVHPLMLGTFNAWLKQTDFSFVLEGKDLDDYYAAVAKTNFSLPKSQSILPKKKHPIQYQYTPTFQSGNLYAFRNTPFPDDAKKIMKRFAVVLNLTFNRFFDLQKAEAQAREARIETALERVRSRTMGMQKSDELAETAAHLFKQLSELGIQPYRCNIGIINSENDTCQLWSTTNKGDVIPLGTFIPLTETPLFIEIYAAWKSKLPHSVIKLVGKDRLEMIKYFIKFIPYAEFKPEEMTLEKVSQVTSIFNTFMFKQGFISIHTNEEISKEDLNVIHRFTKVFEQTYTRFLDLQKAEAQAREAKIEMSLEKVRTVALTMKRSDEMLDIAQALYEQLLELGFTNIRNAIIDLHNEEDETFLDYDYSHDMGKTVTLMSYHDHPIIEKQVRQIQSSSDAFFELILEGQELQDLIDIRLKNGEEEDSRLRQIEQLTYNLYSFGNGAIGISNFGLLSDDQKMVLKRFRNVFAFAYKRYSDMVQSEKQAKEAQIEAALERVRSRSMAMHKSDELADTAAVLFEQMVSLGIVPKRCVIGIINESTRSANFWLTSSEGKVIPGADVVPLTEEKKLIGLYRAWKKKEMHFSFRVSGTDRVNWTKYVTDNAKMHLPEYQPDTINKEQILNEPAVFNSFFFSHGFVMLHTVNDLAEDQIKMLKRFASVFEQTYTRFLDLQKAEAQAREAEIEAALERVRSKTMAMHNSKDVGATVVALFDEVLKLGLDKSIRVGIGILEGNEGMETWSATSTPGGEVDLKMGMLDMTIHPMLVGLKKAWESGETGYSYDYIGDDVFRYYEALNNEPEYPFQADLDSLPENEYHKSFFYREGILFSFAPNPISDEAAKVLDRFAGVFGQTYRRYLDLQKAEEQAREAQIEAALERVRSQAMAMHSSEDLGMTVDTFFTELKSLNVSPHRCGVGIVDRETRIVRVQAVDTNQNNETKKIVGDLKLAGHPVLDKVFESWVKQTEYYPVLRGKEILEYYKVMDPQVKFHEFANDEVQYGYYFYFKEGGVYAWTDNELQEQDIEIFRRYTSVLSLTYRRYLELRDAEARALESVRQASLDRVRAEIASMRTSEDLNHITPIIWRELKNLEVPFFRCGVFIVDKENKKVRVYLTTPDGKSLGVLNLPFDVNTLTTRTVDYWQKKEVYKEHWNKDEFINWTKSMMELGQVASAETYQGSAVPPESLYLHFLPFTQGMLYVGDVKPLTDEKLELVKILAEAFSIAYARYEDFKHLEEAKTRIEITLDELRSAQAQLVHAEKMASLGELTAGIAHEIKNPLNFVNNFSEVSRELLDEMQIEIKNNNIEEVIELVEDLKQNLDKINQHGKRADSIVKGMLLHSRGTSGEKTPTDINDLLDQYVNLAYHGMRAQNKEFNITIEKDYDKSLEKINVVPQDLSRVFLNIINNACYAAFDKKEKDENNFFPTLRVTTRKLNDRVEIKIGDNGNGIPADHLDKIFQPFFTTKPSGEGTGLGLSLSYDIVTKVHGGDLKVETKDSEGTKFFIQLPLL